MPCIRIIAAISVTGSLILAACMFTGCEAQMAALSGRQAISPGDFADPAAEANITEEAAAMPAFAEADEDVETTTPLEMEAVDPDTEVFPAAPSAAPPADGALARQEEVEDMTDTTGHDPTQRVTPMITDHDLAPEPRPANGAGRRIIVDSLIGQVNGRPIFADEFFEPIEDYILAARAQLSPQAFLAELERIIDERLRQVIFNELVLAEAETMLTEETRVGLRYWLKSEEEKRLAQSLGVRAHAEQELAEEGLTLDEYLAMREDQAKIYTLVKEKIDPRVIVTWRDMEREYDRRRDEFNPKASVTLAKIVLNKEREAELIEAVKAGLAQGKSFEEIGKSLSRTSAYSEDTYQLGEQGLAGLPLNPKILQGIEGLEVGQTSEPVEIEILSSQPESAPRITVYWYHIKAIEQREARTLYDPDVQRQLYNELYRRRQAEEQDRYLNSLLGKGIYDDREEMMLRLHSIALRRYGRR